MEFDLQLEMNLSRRELRFTSFDWLAKQQATYVLGWGNIYSPFVYSTTLLSSIPETR